MLQQLVEEICYENLPRDFSNPNFVGKQKTDPRRRVNRQLAFSA
jgi:hypothetical protein